MKKHILDYSTYRDKVLGCWLGKNAGGTLGEPLEERFGREEMFEVDWYPELPEEGLPNDDLEIQLIWLQALQEKGPGIKSRDLAEYWLNCVNYNFDEYGLHKTNLKKGLLPPVSGWYNNWFKDCMGCPIRSEIWACVAPAEPEIAAHYAREDALCDHAGGESVNGELFNVVVESAAFVVEDKKQLLEIGLRAIPEESLTSRVIRRVIDLHDKEHDWKKARNIIKEEFYHPVAQFSPLNLGFQTIGLLYGKDFGDSLCKAVNCGWDTDCTGATLGSILGIIKGGSSLPDKWLTPLGEEISTNQKTGGIKNLQAPTDIQKLTDQVCEMGERVLKYWNSGVQIVKKETTEKKKAEQKPDNFISKIAGKKLLNYNPAALSFTPGTIEVELEYLTRPALTPENPAEIALHISNPQPEALEITSEFSLPEDWTLVSEETDNFILPARETISREYMIKTDTAALPLTDRGYIKFHIEKRPASLSVPLVLVGGFRYLVSPVYQDLSLDQSSEIEQGIFPRCPENWDQVWRTTNDLQAEELFNGRKGVVYLLHFIKSPEEKKVLLGVPNNNYMKFWVNGRLEKETEKRVPLAPNEGGDGANYREVKLKAGLNQVLIKLEKREKPLQAHLVISGIDEKHPINNGRALTDIKRTELPWKLS